MKFLLFASALAVLSSASAHDDDRRRTTSTGTIHFSEQVDGALTLIQKGTNSKNAASPIQQLIYKTENDSGGDGGGNKGGDDGGDDKGGKNDDNDDNDRKGGDKDDEDNDSKGGGNKDSSSSNDRKGGGSSSSSSSNDRKGGGSSSSSSSSGDTRAIDDICNLGHNACDHDNENKGNKKGSDESAFKIECDIVCSTSLCSHDDREQMGCPPSSSAKFVQKGAEFKNAASPIQQLIHKEEEEDGSDGSGDKKDDGSGDKNKDDEDRKGGGDNKDSSSSNDRKGGPSSSSSSNDRKGGPSSSSSSGDNGPSNDGFCNLDCGPETTTQDLCDVACASDICTDAEQDNMDCPGTSGDDERAWKKNLRRRNRKND